MDRAVFLCNLKLAQETGLQFYSTRSHAVVLHNTLPAACIEKAVCLKTQEELYQKVRLTPRVPRVVLETNSQYGQQDPTKPRRKIILGTIKRFDKLRGETCITTVDYRISGVFLSAVEQQDPTEQQSWSQARTF